MIKRPDLSKHDQKRYAELKEEYKDVVMCGCGERGEDCKHCDLLTLMRISEELEAAIEKLREKYLKQVEKKGEYADEAWEHMRDAFELRKEVECHCHESRRLKAILKERDRKIEELEMRFYGVEDTINHKDDIIQEEQRLREEAEEAVWEAHSENDDDHDNCWQVTNVIPGNRISATTIELFSNACPICKRVYERRMSND